MLFAHFRRPYGNVRRSGGAREQQDWQQSTSDAAENYNQSEVPFNERSRSNTNEEANKKYGTYSSINRTKYNESYGGQQQYFNKTRDYQRRDGDDRNRSDMQYNRNDSYDRQQRNRSYENYNNERTSYNDRTSSRSYYNNNSNNRGSPTKGRGRSGLLGDFSRNAEGGGDYSGDRKYLSSPVLDSNERSSVKNRQQPNNMPPPPFQMGQTCYPPPPGLPVPAQYANAWPNPYGSNFYGQQAPQTMTNYQYQNANANFQQYNIPTTGYAKAPDVAAPSDPRRSCNSRSTQ